MASKAVYKAMCASLAFVFICCGAEFLIYDKEFTFTESQKGFWFFQYNSGAPGNWRSPDDYYTGTFHLRYEIKKYPSDKPFKFQLCIWTDGNSEETCSDYTDCTIGVFTNATVPSKWWKKDGKAVDFARPDNFKHLGIVMRKADKCLLSSYGKWCWADRHDYVPMDMRLTVIAVSKGGEFSGWGKYGGGATFIAGPPGKSAQNNSHKLWATCSPSMSRLNISGEQLNDLRLQVVNPGGSIVMDRSVYASASQKNVQLEMSDALAPGMYMACVSNAENTAKTKFAVLK